MAYKKLIKVSNVCQLLDKSKFTTTQIINGVTFTNNGDGTITVNGTATQMAVYIVSYKMHPIIGHKYLITGNPNNSESDWYKVLFYVGTHMGEQHEKIFSVEKSDPISCYITVWNGITVSNLTFKPQLFDLTEMYGAGHEPTTVEQFRQDFPNDLYDYSPRCWLTSYKRVFMTKTKNLFDINSAKKVSGISFSKNGNQITASQTRAEKWKSANVLLDTSLVGKTISLTALAMTDGINNTCIRIQWLANNGLASGRNIQTNIITGNSFQKLTLTGVVPESPGGDFTNLCIMFYSNANSSLESGVTYSSTFTNIQLELGSTATEYVPYGYLTAYQRNLTCKTKNLWTCDKTMSHVIYNSGTQVFKVTSTGSSSCYTLPTPIPAGTTLTITVYCLSGFTKDDVTIGGYHNETGNNSWQCHYRLPSNIDLSGKSFSSTRITTNTLTDFWIFVYSSIPDNLQFKVQLELGDTATDYVPYGYL